MAIPSEQATTVCNHCDRAIPSLNIDLHYAHCSRNLERCKVCGDMIPTKHAEEHYLNAHAPCFPLLLCHDYERSHHCFPTWGQQCMSIGFQAMLCLIFHSHVARQHYHKVACSLCSETMERELLALHKGENCPQRIVTCEYCEFPLPAVDLFKHQEVCGNRTEYCHLCSRYIRLCERFDHESMVHSRSDSTAETSRGRDSAVPDRREEGAPDRRRPPGLLQKRLLFTIAITGIAILLGSIFLQRKVDAKDLQ